MDQETLDGIGTAEKKKTLPAGLAAGLGRNDLAAPLKKERAKRRTIYEQALVGDLLIAYTKDRIVAIEQVRDGVGGDDISERWVAQGVTTDARILVEVWEGRPGFHYRKRKAGR